jgi:hypothetical protein
MSVTVKSIQNTKQESEFLLNQQRILDELLSLFGIGK